MTIKTDEMARFFKALGDPTRIKLLQLLLSGDSLCVGALAEKLHITQPAVSQHLKVLKNEGIVMGKRMGFFVHYQLNREIFTKYDIKLKRILHAEKIDCKTVKTCPSTSRPRKIGDKK